MSLAERYLGSGKLRQVDCPHYQATAGSKRCKDYLSGGACARWDEFMCVAWLKANGHSVPANHPLQPQKDLFGHTVEVRSEPTSTEPEQHLPVRIIQPFSKEELASFKSLGVEVCLASEAFGEIWIVPEYTNQDRKEITIEHAATLSLLVAACPGTRVSSFRSNRNDKESA